MKNYHFKEIAWNFFTVCLGALSSVGIFYFLFLMSAFLPGSWHTVLVLMIILGLSAFLGCFLTASRATRHKPVLGLITLVVLIIVYTNFFDATLNYRNYPDAVLQHTCLLVPALAGIVAGALPSRKNNR